MRPDRGFIKWAPFNSIINGNLVKKELNNKTIIKPSLSLEQKEVLNEQVIEAYYSKNKISIIFYEQNQIKNILAVITKINSPTNTIELNNTKIISFNQILKIKD